MDRGVGSRKKYTHAKLSLETGQSPRPETQIRTTRKLQKPKQMSSQSGSEETKNWGEEKIEKDLVGKRKMSTGLWAKRVS